MTNGSFAFQICRDIENFMSCDFIEMGCGWEDPALFVVVFSCMVLYDRFGINYEGQGQGPDGAAAALPVVQVLHEYVSECDGDFQEYRTLLPLHRASDRKERPNIESEQCLPGVIMTTR